MEDDGDKGLYEKRSRDAKADEPARNARQPVRDAQGLRLYRCSKCNDIDEPEKVAETAKAANEQVLAMIRDAQQAHDRAEGKGKMCSSCNRESPLLAKFCGKCGHPL